MALCIIQVLAYPMRRLFLQGCILSCFGMTFAPVVNSQETSSALRQADAEYRAGVAALNSNELEVALEKFEAVVRLESGIELGHSALGAVLVREGKWTAGIRELEKALALKPSDDVAQLNQAIAYSESGAHAKALPLFAKAEAAARARGTRLPAQVVTLVMPQSAAQPAQPTGEPSAPPAIRAFSSAVNPARAHPPRMRRAESRRLHRRNSRTA